MKFGQLTHIEFHVADDRPTARRVLSSYKGLMKWLADGAPIDFSVPRVVVVFVGADGNRQPLTSQELRLARREPDGRFKLASGGEFYLYDYRWHRWTPKLPCRRERRL